MEMNKDAFSFWQKMGGGIVFIVFALLPVFARDPYLLHLLILTLVFGVLASSWNLLFGFMGVYSFGHQAFFGIGAYMTGILVTRNISSPWVGILLGGVGAALMSLIISWPTFRLKGPYVAIVTLAFAEVLRITCANWVDLTRGQLGLSVPALFSGTSRIESYYFIFLIFSATWVVLRKLMKSPLGLAVIAIRESQEAAESLGVDIVKFKRFAFILTSFMAGIAGAFYAHYIGILTPDVMGTGIIFGILVMGLFGGIGTLNGPILGSLVLTFLAEYLRGFGNFRFLIYSLVIIFIVLFLPGGLIGGARKIKLALTKE
jgi:branched-chain amino acid transport system permease protein